MRARATNRSGFTLIELMVVIILIGIFSGLMLGEMRGTYEDALLRSTARKIIAAANLASSQAITLNRMHLLSIEPNENRVRIQEGENFEDELLDSRIRVDVREVAAEQEDNSEEPLSERDRQQTNRETIRFLPDGTADLREIVLRDRTGVELALRINPITGRIRIVESEAKP